MKRLLIVGAGGLGREVCCWAMDAAPRGVEWTPAGFLDDNPRALEGKPVPLPLLGGISGHVPAADTVLVVAVGRPEVRRRIHEELAGRGAKFANVIHPTAVVGVGARLGSGVVLAPFAVVSAHARIGDGVVLNFHSVVQHDAELGAWSQLNSHADAGGFSVLGEEVLVGTHGVVRARARVPNRQQISPGCIFEAGNG